MEIPLDNLISEAIALNSTVKGNDVGHVQDRLQDEISRLSMEFDLDALIPGEGGGTLGMAAKRRDSKAFYELFIKRVRTNLCTEDGEFTKLIHQGLQSSVGATVTALVMSLGLPAATLALLIPLAVLICHSGLEAFCAIGAGG